MGIPWNGTNGPLTESRPKWYETATSHRRLAAFDDGVVLLPQWGGATAGAGRAQQAHLRTPQLPRHGQITGHMAGQMGKVVESRTLLTQIPIFWRTIPTANRLHTCPRASSRGARNIANSPSWCRASPDRLLKASYSVLRPTLLRQDANQGRNGPWIKCTALSWPWTIYG